MNNLARQPDQADQADPPGDWDGFVEIVIIEDEDGNLIAMDADDTD